MIRLMFDAGHDGKRNQSPVVKTYYESQAMWNLHLKVKAYLEAMGGFEIGMTRKSVNEVKDVNPRGAMAKGYDAFISFHTNACATESVNRATAIYLAPDKKTNADEKSKELADLLAKVCENTIGTTKCNTYYKLAGYDRNGNGITTDDDYYGVLYSAHKVGVPAIILECTFHTNKNATLWMSKDSNLDILAQQIAIELYNYYYHGAKAPEPVEQKPVVTPTPATTNNKFKLDGYDTTYVFDPTFYANKYADLKQAFGTNASALFSHWVTYGLNEGRQAHPTFDVIAYKNRYVDLQNAFGNDLKAYVLHYLKYGRKENRCGY